MNRVKRNEYGADPECQACHGTGTVVDRVPRPFGPGNVGVTTACECLPPVYAWAIVAFEHPQNGHSIAYRQNLTEMTLIKVLTDAIKHGANLVSIRGVLK